LAVREVDAVKQTRRCGPDAAEGLFVDGAADEFASQQVSPPRCHRDIPTLVVGGHAASKADMNHQAWPGFVQQLRQESGHRHCRPVRVKP
jgi:hypothetical protein